MGGPNKWKFCGIGVREMSRNPVVKIDELAADSLNFQLDYVDTSMANAFRRVMISEVPTMAIEFVNIEINTSVVTDEFLAHRLGLVPLVSVSADRYHTTRDCPCRDGLCDNCSVKFRMHVKCNEHSCEVTSKDLHAITEHCDVVPVREESVEDGREANHILLAKLRKGQEIKLEAIAKKSIGKDHAKWSPVAVCTYQFQPSIHIHASALSEMTTQEKQSFVNSCPTKVYRYNDNDHTVEIAEPTKCMYCNECVDRAVELDQRHLVDVRPIDDRFLFSVETTGSLPPEDVFLTSVNVLRDKLSMLHSEISQA